MLPMLQQTDSFVTKVAVFLNLLFFKKKTKVERRKYVFKCYFLHATDMWVLLIHKRHHGVPHQRMEQVIVCLDLHDIQDKF